jgi:hypothetical protein
MQSADSKGLFRCPVRVRRGQGCEMPGHLLGAFVDCFVGAPNSTTALRLAVEQLATQGFVFEDLLEGKVHQLDPQKWDEFIDSTWADVPGQFPTQEEMLRFVEVGGGVFYGPFIAWESEGPPKS